jgi:predicted phage replisome organizer
MSDDKKYYYLKLRADFFDSDEIVVMESMQDGHLYCNILLKLYLRSLRNEGKLMFNDRIPYNSNVLAQVVRHPVGVVEKAIKVFQDFGLIEILDNGAIYLLDIQTYIGLSSSEADRKRLYRKKIDAEKQKLLPKGQMSEKCPDKYPPEIEIERKIEREIDIEIENNIMSTKKEDNHLAMIKYDVDHQYYQIAKYLKDKILLINDKSKVPTDNPKSMEKWADDVRKIIKLDKRTLDEFKEIIDFTFKSDFWATVIQSPAGLRKNWDKVFAQMKRPKASNSNVISFDRQMEVCREFLEEG